MRKSEYIKRDNFEPNRKLPKAYIHQFEDALNQMGIDPNLYLDENDDLYLKLDKQNAADEFFGGRFYNAKRDHINPRKEIEMIQYNEYLFYETFFFAERISLFADFLNIDEGRFFNQQELDEIADAFLRQYVPYDKNDRFKKHSFWIFSSYVYLNYDWSDYLVDLIHTVLRDVAVKSVVSWIRFWGKENRSGETNLPFLEYIREYCKRTDIKNTLNVDLRHKRYNPYAIYGSRTAADQVWFYDVDVESMSVVLEPKSFVAYSTFPRIWRLCEATMYRGGNYNYTKYNDILIKHLSEKDLAKYYAGSEARKLGHKDPNDYGWDAEEDED